MPTGHSSEPDTLALIGALDAALSAALSITFDHDDNWPPAVRQEASERIKHIASLVNSLRLSYGSNQGWGEELAKE